MNSVWSIPIILAVAVLLLAGCMRPPPLEAPAGATLTPLRTISPLEAKFLLALSGVRGLPVAHPVDCYRMEYSGAGPRGEAVRLSGLFALPRGVPARRLVSFQHGTSTTRTAVPSRPDGTGLASAILFAGNGYALIAPDYPGMGVSPGHHPYYAADAIGPSVADMIETAMRVKGVPQTPVFLAGFSEGGWASLAALRTLEERGVPVLGSAQVAGPYDLRNVSLPAAMKGGAPAHSLYLAYMAWGYSAYYGHPLDSVFTADMARLTERLFDGAKPKQILAGLPADPRRLFRPEVLEAYDQGRPHWFFDTIAANGLIGFTPKAPVRMYYGERDLDVVPEESRAAAQAMRARGADVVSENVGPVGHDASMLAAAPRIFAWLKSLETAPPPASAL